MVVTMGYWLLAICGLLASFTVVGKYYPIFTAKTFGYHCSLYLVYVCIFFQMFPLKIVCHISATYLIWDDHCFPPFQGISLFLKFGQNDCEKAKTAETTLFSMIHYTCHSQNTVSMTQQRQLHTLSIEHISGHLSYPYPLTNEAIMNY